MRIFTQLLQATCCFLLLTAFNTRASAQCGAGETELILEIDTDNWGYECYWQITPQGNACDDGTIAEGGNLVQVGCGGAGDQDATTAQGYADNTIITVEDICLTIGSSYTLHYIDDYGDGGGGFSFNLFGYPILAYQGTGNGGTFNFTVNEPLQYDVQGTQVLSYSYVQPTDNEVRGKFMNLGSEVITSVEMNYSSDGGATVTETINGLSVNPFTSFELTHPTLWNETDGEHDLTIWISSINGNADMNTLNDVATDMITVGPGIPNILEDYLGFIPETEVIASAVNPRDLDFHPILTRNELWVVLKSTENNGGLTVKITNAGEANQDELQQEDGNAWHFMSLPTGIAFSRNENFATSPGVYDANHDGGSPFTGPALWSSDPDIYAQPSGGNGSHLDMLHESPYSMGIAWEEGNKFWLTCGDHNEIMSYDFNEDHGPGNDDHSDGVIYKYPIPGYNEDPAHEVPDHLVLDHTTGWLYVCNSQQNRVIRIDTQSGTPGDDVTPSEAVEVYAYMDNFTWEEYITVGLDEPSGIDIVEDRMIVSNYNNGDIHLYDISQSLPILLGVIPTGSNGIMGVKIGPDGLIWYVNSVTDKVMRASMTPISVDELAPAITMNIAPNPAGDVVTVNLSNTLWLGKAQIRIMDNTGRLVLQQTANARTSTLDVSSIAQGVYSLQLADNGKVLASEKIVIQ